MAISELTLKTLNNMELFYFSSGILAVVLAYTVVGVFRLNNKVNRTERGIEDAYIRIDNTTDELYRALDSRLDKLEHRLTK